VRQTRKGSIISTDQVGVDDVVLRFPGRVVEANPRDLVLVLAIDNAMGQDAVDVAL